MHSIHTPLGGGGGGGVEMHAQSCLTLFMTSWIAAHKVPLSMEFSRQEYWSALPFPSLGDLPDPGMEPTTSVLPSLAGEFFTTAPPGKPLIHTPKRSPNYRKWVVVNFSFFESSLGFSVRRKLDP